MNEGDYTVTFNNCVTIYHLNGTDGYAPNTYTASVYCGSGVRSDGAGFANDGMCSVRIPSCETAVECNDYVFIGETSEPLDKDRCYRITSVHVNRRGVLPHTRIECARAYKR